MLLIANTLQAENWELINTDNANSSFYINKDDLKTEGNVKILWGKVILSPEMQKEYKKATGVDAKYNKMHMGIDCKEQKACQFGFITYDENDNIVEENEITEENRFWSEIPEGRPIKAVYDSVCK